MSKDIKNCGQRAAMKSPPGAGRATESNNFNHTLKKAVKKSIII
jgi:hypothetical protein